MDNQNLTVTNENLAEVLDTVVIGNIALQNYGKDGGISTSDLRLADSGSHLLQKVVELVADSGNSIYQLIQPTFLEHGYNCNHHYNEADFAHITDVTPFSADIPNAAYVYSICQSAKASVTDRAAFLAENEYR